MTEEEKIFAGKLFYPQSIELRDVKHKAHEKCREYNTLDEYDAEHRNEIVLNIMGEIGPNFYIQGPMQFNYGSHTFIGKNFFANYNLTVLDDNKIFIGDNVMIAPNVSLMAASHPLIKEERFIEQPDGTLLFTENADEIHIGNNVWIGCGVTVLGGVHIGNDAVIGAGSLVNRDIPEGVLAAGNPCKVIKKITKKDSKLHLLAEG